MIKNKTAFLAAATVITCFATPIAHAAGITSFLFRNLEADKGIILPAKTADNAEVIYFKGVESNLKLPEGTRQAFGDNFTLQGEFQGNRACVVYTEAPTASVMKFMFDKNGKESLIFINDEYMAHIATHEVSHCLNHDFHQSNRAVNALLSDRDFADFKLQVRTLDLAIRETHADLISTLIGASKTGDWSTFGNVILPLRSAKFDPRHTTLSAVYQIIEKINPEDLHGKNLAQVAELGNLLFRKSFYSGNAVSLNSSGVYSIMQDWLASGKEQIFVADRVRNPETIKGARIVARYTALAEKILGRESAYDASHATRYYNLKQLAIHQQYAMAQSNLVAFRSSIHAEEMINYIKGNLAFLKELTNSSDQNVKPINLQRLGLILDKSSKIVLASNIDKPSIERESLEVSLN